MPVQAIIKKSKMPESCFSCDYDVEYCYGHECGISLHRGDCPFYKVPEWTEEDSEFINLMLGNIKNLQKKVGDNEITALKVLTKLCQLALRIS